MPLVIFTAIGGEDDRTMDRNSVGGAGPGAGALGRSGALICDRCCPLPAIISCGNDDPNLGRGFGGRGDQDRGRALSAGRTDPDLYRNSNFNNLR